MKSCPFREMMYILITLPNIKEAGESYIDWDLYREE